LLVEFFEGVVRGEGFELAAERAVSVSLKLEEVLALLLEAVDEFGNLVVAG